MASNTAPTAQFFPTSDPSQQANIADFQRRQMLAQMLLKQSDMPNAGDMGGAVGPYNVAVKHSPLEYAVQALKQGLAGQQQNKANQELLQLQGQQWADMLKQAGGSDAGGAAGAGGLSNAQRMKIAMDQRMFGDEVAKADAADFARTNEQKNAGVSGAASPLDYANKLAQGAEAAKAPNLPPVTINRSDGSTQQVPVALANQMLGAGSPAATPGLPAPAPAMTGPPVPPGNGGASPIGMGAGPSGTPITPAVVAAQNGVQLGNPIATVANMDGSPAGQGPSALPVDNVTPPSGLGGTPAAAANPTGAALGGSSGLGPQVGVTPSAAQKGAQDAANSGLKTYADAQATNQAMAQNTPAKQKLDSHFQRISDLYDQLHKLGSTIEEGGNPVNNIYNTLSNSSVDVPFTDAQMGGQPIARMVGTPSQTVRDNIAAEIKQTLPVYMSALGITPGMERAQASQEMLLKALGGNINNSYQHNKANIANLSREVGMGTVKGLLDPAQAKIMAQQAIAKGAPAAQVQAHYEQITGQKW